MKLFESEHSFTYPWEQVTAANWQKYPNELSTHVVSVDILDRSIDPETNILRTERLIGCKQPIPRWLSAIVGGLEMSYVREVSEVDLVNKTLVMKSHNITMNHLLSVNETVIYKPDTDLPKNSTKFIQEAEITAFSSFSRICDKIENWSVDRFGQNAKIGKLGFESVLETLSAKWDASVTDMGNSVSDMGNTLIKEVNNVTDKTSEVLAEVSKLGNVFSKDN